MLLWAVCTAVVAIAATGTATAAVAILSLRYALAILAVAPSVIATSTGFDLVATIVATAIVLTRANTTLALCTLRGDGTALAIVTILRC